MTATDESSGPAAGPSEDGPLVEAPEGRAGWFVSLVPPPDCLPLEVDLRGPREPVPVTVPPARLEASAQELVPDLVVQPLVAELPAELPAELSPRGAGVPAPRPELRPADPVPAGDAPPTRGLRTLWQGGLPTPLVVGAAVLLLVPGVLIDATRDGTFGLPSTTMVVLAGLAAPLLLRVRSLAVGAVLPPLLFATAVSAIAWRSGLNHGRREIGLDVGTTMALHAPLLFLVTAAAVVVVAGRLVVRLARR